MENLKFNADKLDIDKLKKLQSSLRNLNSKLYKLAVDKLVPAHVRLSKLSDAVKIAVARKMYIILK